MRVEMNLWMLVLVAACNLAPCAVAVWCARHNYQTAQKLQDEAAILMAVSKRLTALLMESRDRDD